MDNEMGSDLTETTWPELSADLTLARTQARSIMLDTQRANSDGRILELSAQIELMRTRMSSLEQHLFDARNETPRDLAERLDVIDTTLRATGVRFDSFSSRVSAADEQTKEALESMEATTEARMGVVETTQTTQTNELNELSGYIDESFDRIAQLATIIDMERDENIVSRRDWSLHSEHINSKIADVETSLTGLDRRIDEATTTIEAASANALDELTATIAEQSARLDVTEDAVEAAHEQIESTNHRVESLTNRLAEHTEAQDEIATTIQFLQSRANALDESAQSLEDEQASQASRTSKVVEQIDLANVRLDAGLSELASLRADIEAKPDSIATEYLDALEELSLIHI